MREASGYYKEVSEYLQLLGTEMNTDKDAMEDIKLNILHHSERNLGKTSPN